MEILRIDNISYKIKDKEILKGITYKVFKGDCISIIGESGSGKSTLLKLLGDLISQSSGEGFYKNKNYKEYDPIILRRDISYCIQVPYLFGEKVYENVEFPYKIRGLEFNKNRVLELFNLFNLTEDFLEKNINSLSGGEKQRISIIRNLIFTPEILLLDEATSALDCENANIIEKYICELNRNGVTVLWITHSISQSEGIFNKRLTLKDGEIINVEVLK